MIDKEYLESLPHGEDRLVYLKKCIAEADAEKDYRSMVWLRHDYIQESVFHDDSFKAIIMFPEFMKLFDEHPDVMKPVSFMFPFKWILDNCVNYYQVTIEQIESYFERFKEYIEKFGYTMRTYYLEKYSVYLDIDTDIALEAFDKFENYDRTEMSDCRACEASCKAKKEMRFGSPEKAVKMLNEMLDRNMTCTRVPQVTYGGFANCLARRGMYDEAEHYAGLMLPMVRGEEVNYCHHICKIIELKSITDPNGAYDLFCRCAGKYSRVKNPSYRFDFACAAYKFFTALAVMGEEEISMSLSSEFEFFREDGNYNVAELRDKFYDIAADLAEKFDSRGGNTYRADELAFVYPEAPEKRLELPVHGAVPPESPVLGLMLGNPGDIPFNAPEDFIQTLTEKCGLSEIGFGMDEESGRIFISGVMDGEPVKYAFSLHDAPDFENFKPVHWFADGELEGLGSFANMAVIYSMIPASDRFGELKKLLKLAAAVDRGNCPVILDLTNTRMFSKRWLALEAEGDTDPFTHYYTRTWIYRSSFAEEGADLITSGMAIFGSREFIVPAVKEEDIEFVLSVLNNLMRAASVTTLRDEGVTMNSGIVYDEKSFIRFTWRPLSMPADETSEDMQDEEQQEPAVFAEPILYLTAADQEQGRGFAITELSEEVRGKLDFRTLNRFTVTEEEKCRERFPQVLEYFRTHDCDVIVGSYYTHEVPGSEDGDSDEERFFHGRLEKVGDEVKIRVETTSPNISSVLHEGDLADIDPDSVFFVRIDLDGGEDRYYVDEFYILLKAD